MSISRWLLVPLLLMVASLATACGGGSGPNERVTITVAAASDLRPAFEELGRLFGEKCSCEVVFSFGSSGTLATQIKAGLNVDVFASADTAYVDDLDKSGLILLETKQLYAIGRIVFAVPASSSLQLTSLNDLLRAEFRKISIANPEHAPYGRAAKQALEKQGIWGAIQSRIVLGENASLATQYVQTQNAEAGIVPLSLAIQAKDTLRYVIIDESMHEQMRQVAAVTRGSKHADVAKGFLAYVSAPEGREVMRKYGFVLPGETVAR